METGKKYSDISVNAVEDFPRAVLALSVVILATFPGVRFGW